MTTSNPFHERACTWATYPKEYWEGVKPFKDLTKLSEADAVILYPCFFGGAEYIASEHEIYDHQDEVKGYVLASYLIKERLGSVYEFPPLITPQTTMALIRLGYDLFGLSCTKLEPWEWTTHMLAPWSFTGQEVPLGACPLKDMLIDAAHRGLPQALFDNVTGPLAWGDHSFDAATSQGNDHFNTYTLEVVGEYGEDQAEVYLTREEATGRVKVGVWVSDKLKGNFDLDKLAAPVLDAFKANVAEWMQKGGLR